MEKLIPDKEAILAKIQQMKESQQRLDGSELLPMQKNKTDCELCHDNGGEFINKYDEELGYTYQAWQPCQCSEQRDIGVLFKASRISEEFQKKSFDNFILTDRPQAVRDAHYCAKAYAKEFSEIREKRKNSLAICGRPGSGKTHLLMAVANELIRNKVAVMYFPWVEALNNLKDDFSLLDTRIRELQNAPVLFVDDLFKGRKEPTDFQIEISFAIINDRYLNKRPILLSSELTVDQMIALDEGIGSRIAEMCRDFTVFMVGGRELNYRLKEDAS